MDEQRWMQLLDRQRELEDNSLALGGARFRRKLEAANTKGVATVHGAARRLLQEAIVPMENALLARITAAENNRGVKPLVVKWAPLVGADVAAYMTVKVVLDGAGRKTILRKAALQVSELIIDELRYRELQTKAPYLFDYKVKHFQTSNYRHMSGVLDQTIRYVQGKNPDELDLAEYHLDTKGRMLLGTQLINILVEATGLVEANTIQHFAGQRKGWKGETYVQPTEETQAWLNTRNASLEMLLPVALPMVTAPLQWSAQQRGGYRFAMRGKHALVRGQTKAHGVAIKAANLPVVYAALNRIQETPWKINADVLALIEEIQEKRGGFAGVPNLEQEEMPQKPNDIAENFEARRVWKRAAHMAKERNHNRHLKALEYTRTMSVARSMREEEAIFFPFNLDFRGRVYPIGTYLHPQGDDLAKSLLTFAEGKPLGEHGAYWLAVHGMNKLGDTPDGMKVSHMTLGARVQWVKEHERDIIAAAQNPMQWTWWSGADKPLQFFAFCREWTDSLFTTEGNGGQSMYVSHLPVAMDGSCNGLQHFSAMLRDEVGGAEVNLVPNVQPQDIYQAIADEVLAKLERLAADEAVAARWLTSGLVTRKLTKRPTMTFGYGSKQFGFQEQLQEYLHGLDNWAEVKAHFLVVEEGKEKNGIPEACRLMASLVWTSLSTVVVAAFNGMEWMQAASKLASADGKCVRWTVPETGFPVQQEYYHFKRQQVRTILAGKIVKPSVWSATQDVNLAKQANAISPNFIHSLDAAALMLTVERAALDGVDSFAMVHDSYGTHAADCAVFNRATRQSFVKLYTENEVLTNLASELKSQTAEENLEDFPEVPAFGNLDLGGILASDYFFA